MRPLSPGAHPGRAGERSGPSPATSALPPNCPRHQVHAPLADLNMQRPSPATRITRSPVSIAGPAAARAR